MAKCLKTKFDPQHAIFKRRTYWLRWNKDRDDCHPYPQLLINQAPHDAVDARAHGHPDPHRAARAL